MTELQAAYYIVALVFMGVIFLMIIVLLIAVFKIKSKINAVHDAIEHRVDSARQVGHKAGIVLNTIRYFLKP